MTDLPEFRLERLRRRQLWLFGFLALAAVAIGLLANRVAELADPDRNLGHIHAREISLYGYGQSVPTLRLTADSLGGGRLSLPGIRLVSRGDAVSFGLGGDGGALRIGISGGTGRFTLSNDLAFMLGQYIEMADPPEGAL